MSTSGSSSDTYTFPYARYPAVRVVLCLITGIVISGYLPGAPVWVLAGALMVFLVMETILYQSPKPWLAALVRWVYMGILILFGVVHASGHESHPSPVEVMLNGLEGRAVTLAGPVREVRTGQSGALTLVMDVDSIKVNQIWQQADVRTQLRVFRPDSSWSSVTLRNYYIFAEAQITAFPQRRNPMAFDVGRWLRTGGIQLTAQGTRLISGEPRNSRLSWIWWRAGMHDLLDRTVREDVRPLFKAILLGDKGDLDRDVRTAFSRAGLSHLMAVSGMHVGFVLMPVWALIPWFWTNDAGRSAGLLFIAAILLFYAGLTGFSSSVSRASITACLLAVGKLFQRNRDSLNTTGVAAILLLVWNPTSLQDVGFQMSFVAVSLILVLGPVIRDMVPTRIRFTWMGTVLLFLGISIIVQTGLFPILASTFGEFSVAGPLANTIGVPLTQALFLWSMVALPLALVWDGAASFAMIPAEWMASILLWLAKMVGSHEMSWISIDEISSLTGLLWLALVGCLATLRIPAIRFKWVIVCLLILCAMQAEQVYEQLKPSVLRVIVYDVGQGDAVLIQTPGGRHILYDTGVLTPFQNSGRSVIAPDLKARGVRHIDAVILSHPHADHIGGMLTLIEEFSIGVIYQAPMTVGTAVFSGYMRAAERMNIPVVEVYAGDVLVPDPAVRILVLHPDASPFGNDPNAWSVSVKLVHGATSFLLTGDAEALAEHAMMRRFGAFLKSDWYKAGHHGSKTSSGPDFMRYVDPDFAAVSLGYRNRYRHPHAEATRSIHRHASHVGFTSLHGALIYESDGYAIRPKAF